MRVTDCWDFKAAADSALVPIAGTFWELPVLGVGLRLKHHQSSLSLLLKNAR